MQEKSFKSVSIVCSDRTHCISFYIARLISLFESVGVLEHKTAKNTEVIERLHSLSRKYRLALTTCVNFWSDANETVVQHMQEDSSQQQDESNEAMLSSDSLEYLKIMLTVMHLSEIYLLPQPIPNGVSTSVASSSNSNIPGSLTADTIRYLRLNVMDDKYAIVEDFSASLSMSEDVDPLQQMLDSNCPEYWGNDNSSTTEGAMSIYWRQVRALVARGCLKEAWDLIVYHSLCVNDGPSSDQQGFLHLRAIMLSAPLPGGRDDVNDDGFEELHRQEEDETRQQQSLVEIAKRDENEDGEEPLLEGIPPNAYKGWNIIRDLNSGVAMHTAVANWNTWSNYVQRIAQDGSLAGGLLQHIPALRWAVLDVLAGQAPIDSYNSWAEAFCASLLYQRPTIRVADIPIRMEAVLKAYKEDQDETNTGIVLPIMNKNAGKAILTLHSIGGGSGAALPAAITALMCDLLVLSKSIPVRMAVGGNLEVNFRRELLLAAAIACESSFHDLLQPQVGVEYASKVYRIEGSARAKHAWQDMIGRQMPKSDAEAKLLLQICATQSHLSDAGCSVALCRARHYMKESRPGGVTHWMLRGVECEVRGAEGAAKRAQHRSKASTQFGAFCTTLALRILETLPVKELDEEIVPPLISSATEVVTTSTDDNSLGALDGIASASFALLSNVTAMAKALLQEERATAATKVVACLAHRADSDGVSLPLAHESMWCNFLRVALNLMEADEHAPLYQALPTFSVKGVQTLMTRFQALESSDNRVSLFRSAGIITAKEEMDSVDIETSENYINIITMTVPEIRLLLGRALMRASVQENGQLKLKAEQDRKRREKQESDRHAPALVGEAEEPIELMLGPPPCLL
jgi:hypothetical protein